MSPCEHPSKRQAPVLYERFVPIALAVIVVLMLILGFVTIAVLLDLLPG